LNLTVFKPQRELLTRFTRHQHFYVTRRSNGRITIENHLQLDEYTQSGMQAIADDAAEALQIIKEFRADLPAVAGKVMRDVGNLL